MEAFTKEYAHFYDIFYQDKDYKTECDFLEGLFRRFSPGSLETILDVACGTGGHLIPLLKRGYEVVGNDLSPQMIALAKQKLVKEGIAAKLIVSPMQKLALDPQEIFDAVICMFASINYLSAKDIPQALDNFRRHLRQGGLLVFDFWNAEVVEAEYEPWRTKTFTVSDLVITRTSRTTLKPERQLCTLRYEVVVSDTAKSEVVNRFSETHLLKYYYPAEMRDLVEARRFKVVALGPFLDLRGESKKAWNLCLVAKAV